MLLPVSLPLSLVAVRAFMFRPICGAGSNSKSKCGGLQNRRFYGVPATSKQAPSSRSLSCGVLRSSLRGFTAMCGVCAVCACCFCLRGSALCESKTNIFQTTVQVSQELQAAKIRLAKKNKKTKKRELQSSSSKLLPPSSKSSRRQPKPDHARRDIPANASPPASADAGGGAAIVPITRNDARNGGDETQAISTLRDDGGSEPVRLCMMCRSTLSKKPSERNAIRQNPCSEFGNSSRMPCP